METVFLINPQAIDLENGKAKIKIVYGFDHDRKFQIHEMTISELEGAILTLRRLRLQMAAVEIAKGADVAAIEGKLADAGEAKVRSILVSEAEKP
jgi:hypothetical protein